MSKVRKARRGETPKKFKNPKRQIARRRRENGILRDPGPCPACGDCEPRLVDSSEIYGRSYGKAWVCGSFPECRTYVGCHAGTDLPLGTLADGPLRWIRHQCHEALDPLWQKKIVRDQTAKHEARNAAYRWLAGELGIPRTECHFGMFDIATCWQALEILAPYSEPARRTLRDASEPIKRAAATRRGRTAAPAPEGATPR